MGGTCGTHGRCEKYKILVGKPERKMPLGAPEIDGKTVLKWILKKEGVDSIGSG
jgi:hypothetical protein